MKRILEHGFYFLGEGYNDIEEKRINNELFYKPLKNYNVNTS